MSPVKYLIQIDTNTFSTNKVQTEALDHLSDMLGNHIPNKIYKVNVSDGGYVCVRDSPQYQGQICLEVQKRTGQHRWFPVIWSKMIHL